jgi:hypothetical protein
VGMNAPRSERWHVVHWNPGRAPLTEPGADEGRHATADRSTAKRERRERCVRGKGRPEVYPVRWQRKARTQGVENRTPLPTKWPT